MDVTLSFYTKLVLKFESIHSNCASLQTRVWLKDMVFAPKIASMLLKLHFSSFFLKKIISGWGSGSGLLYVNNSFGCHSWNYFGLYNPSWPTRWRRRWRYYKSKLLFQRLKRWRSNEFTILICTFFLFLKQNKVRFPLEQWVQLEYWIKCIVHLKNIILKKL